MIFFTLFNLVAFLTSILAHFSDDYNLRAHNTIPNNTVSILQNNPNYTYHGPATLSWTWNTSDFSSLPEEEKWLKQPITWLIYDERGNGTLLHEMTCYYQVSKSAKAGDVYQVEQLLQAPYLKPAGGTDEFDMVQYGNVVCPYGVCVAPNCSNLTIPTYDVVDLISSFTSTTRSSSTHDYYNNVESSG
nr:uncharacterized protein I203_04847 [Kwoniella mangroviensis CBS 8507]OCF65827.1 hypothetical protein I203_04847 [Kwoniella mangroviensis CBS 8507]